MEDVADATLRMRLDLYAYRWEGMMEFRLTYEGPLLSSGNSPKPENKHQIRMKLSPQLKRLWATQKELAAIAEYRGPTLEKIYEIAPGGPFFGGTSAKPYLEHLADSHRLHGAKWLPLVHEDMHLTCAIDVLFLRPGARGGVLKMGDIDGRLKTLFDALSIPQSNSGIPEFAEGDPPEIYTLLSDDALITHVSVTTDELLEPTSPTAGDMDARLIMTLNIRPSYVSWFNMGFSCA